MSTGLIAVVVAFLSASLRALELWRANARVDVINAVVVTMFGEGRAADVAQVLRVGGRAPYVRLAESLCEVARPWSDEPGFSAAGQREVRQRLEAHVARALVIAHRSLRRNGWLDIVTLAAIVVAGVGSAMTGATTGKLVLMQLAATQLWLANVLTVRSISARMVAGAMTLAEGLTDVLVQASNAVPAQHPKSEAGAGDE